MVLALIFLIMAYLAGCKLPPILILISPLVYSISSVLGNTVISLPKLYILGYLVNPTCSILGLFVILERHLYSTIDDIISFHNEYKLQGQNPIAS